MENLASLEPFLFRTFQDSWISEAYARDTETLTKALQKSLFSDNNLICSDTQHPPTTPTASNVSGSDPETVAPPKRQRNGIPATSGKVSKRKSRASKRSQTTFITADPANFRQMVQQVTGVRFGNAQLPPVPVLKPEPQRPGTRLHAAAGCLPTLDTSAFLLDHHQQPQMVVSVTPGSGSGTGSGSGPGPATVSFPQPVVADGGPTAGLDYDTFSSFPTLESWKVM
ncbi:hypothetical protein JCGZ_06394 [Jatropha curcas]|uniref:VQ domain-containing protein n=1 Tax=Jatropha curcas TaxID=180498 RepID=A0A067L166_JATCU|nr:calmodulin-binding protein 25 [Jatropha curcas]KDP37839.1 hypothetical protein JCGZ_06394 [Jatropha curcas]